MARVILFLATAVIFAVATSGYQHSELPRKWLGTNSRPTQAPLMDPCQKERNMKMICHCEHQTTTNNHQTDKTIRAAECWILKNDLTPQDPLWKAFDRYTAITELKFVVQSGSLTFLPTMVFKKLIKISEVTVSFSNVNAIESFAFANSSSVRQIRMNNNNLTILQRNAFANHGHLERLDLQENEIQNIDQHAFANLSSLEYLALNNNKISEIQEGTFSGLNNLLELQLQHNWITGITAKMFHRLENLRALKLSSNKITFIGGTAFIELWSLQELYLDNNHIEKISARAFDGLNNLRKMSLQRNRLTALDDALFMSLPILEWLNLSGNRLKTLQPATFSSILDNFLRNDSSLILNGNNLVCDCTLNWLNGLRNRTSSVETQLSIDSLQCLWMDSESIPEEMLLLNTNLPNNWHNRDYISDDVEMDHSTVDLQAGSIVNLPLLGQLPCNEIPTSLPMPRESTGFRSSASSLRTYLYTLIVICLVVI